VPIMRKFSTDTMFLYVSENEDVQWSVYKLILPHIIPYR